MNDLHSQLLKNNIIDGDRIKLRPVTLDDTQDMFEYASDEGTAYYVFPTNNSTAETERNILNIFMTHPAGQYGIELKSQKKMIGTLQLLNIDEINKKASLAFVLNKSYQRHGYMGESIEMLLDSLFHHTDFERVYALHHTENTNSERVMDKVGMKKEGVLKHAAQLHGNFSDGCLHAVLRDEYLNIRKKEYGDV